MLGRNNKGQAWKFLVKVDFAVLPSKIWRRAWKTSANGVYPKTLQGNRLTRFLLFSLAFIIAARE